MKRAIWAAAVIGVIGVAVLGGCSTPSSSPTPTTASSTAASERYGAPEVVAPRDLGVFVSSPCGLLTSTEQRWLGLTVPPSTRQAEDGVFDCTWEDYGSLQSLSLVPITGRDYLVDSYRVRQYRVFQPTTIENLPAVRQQSGPESSSCSITVGLDSDQALNAQYYDLSGESTGDPCGRLERAVALAVAKLPPGK